MAIENVTLDHQAAQATPTLESMAQAINNAPPLPPEVEAALVTIRAYKGPADAAPPEMQAAAMIFLRHAMSGSALSNAL